MSEEDEQFNQAFGEHTGISIRRRDDISNIKDNNSDVKDFKLYSPDADCFTDLSWRLLGRYIANNTHLNEIGLIRCNITDTKMASLFSELTCSVSLTKFILNASGTSSGIEGLRTMVTFLQNSPNLSDIRFAGSNNINTEGFELLVSTLHGRPLEIKSLNSLYLSCCGITNISVLETYNLQDLQYLNLSGNNIGREGCITISNLLQQEGSTLTEVFLLGTGMGDEEAELLATTLKHNTTLESLYLQNNNFTEEGKRAFLKLLVEASSIESTYNSNHTLKCLSLYYSWEGVSDSIKELVESTIQINKSNNSPHSAGRMKVIKYQLNCKIRKEICDLQGIEYSAGSNFADLEPTLLPRILALIGREHCHNEFYTALIPMVPTLMSCIDTSGMMKDLMVKNKARDNNLAAQIAALTLHRAALTAKNDQLSRRLTERESGDSRHSTKEEVGTEESMATSGKKRRKMLG